MKRARACVRTVHARMDLAPAEVREWFAPGAVVCGVLDPCQSDQIEQVTCEACLVGLQRYAEAAAMSAPRETVGAVLEGTDEVARARARRTVRDAFGTLDADAALVVRSLGSAGDRIEMAFRRLLGSRVTAEELEELERMKATALRIFGRLTPAELAELLAIIGGADPKGGA